MSAGQKSKTDTTSRIVPGQRVRTPTFGEGVVEYSINGGYWHGIKYDSGEFGEVHIDTIEPIDDEPEAGKVEYQLGDVAFVKCRVVMGSGNLYRVEVEDGEGVCLLDVPPSDLRKP